MAAIQVVVVDFPLVPVTATIGPSISRASYEVGPELRDRFVAADEEHRRFFIPSPDAERTDRWHFDLPAFIAAALAAAGVGGVESLDLCTYADEGEYYSYRRATHRGETDYGRQISVIRL